MQVETRFVQDLRQERQYHEYYEIYVKQAAEDIRSELRGAPTPEFGITLGSGLGALAESIEKELEIPYKEIYFFPQPTIPGHEGTLIYGTLEGVPVIGLKGRKHYYEVADRPYNNGLKEIVFPVHVLAELGVKNYFVTNAAGGLTQGPFIGHPMIITSHNGLFFPNVLAGRKLNFQTIQGEPTKQFQPMNDAYDEELTNLLLDAGTGRGAQKGTYIAVTGPTYETVAECLFLRGENPYRGRALAVGMSTVPEVITARNRGMRCVGMSCITNEITEKGINATNHEEVQAILGSKETKQRLENTVKEFFKLYHEQTI